MLVLPTGEVLWSSDAATNHPEVAVFSHSGQPANGWRPVINTVAASLTVGSTANPIKGHRFNGWSLGASYGSAAQESSNYPLVRIINSSTAHVCWARSYQFSTMGVWTAGPTTAEFDIPKAPIKTGEKQMVQVHYSEGVANHTGPESCVEVPRGRGEALTGESTGQPSSRESKIPEADVVGCTEGNIGGRAIASGTRFRRGRQTLACVDASGAGIGRSRHRPPAGNRCGPHREGEEP
jgi:hypothetical protein